MLRARLFYAALIVVPLLTIFWLDYYFAPHSPGMWLSPLVFLVGMLAAIELRDMLRPTEVVPSPIAFFGGMLILLGCIITPLLLPATTSASLTFAASDHPLWLTAGLMGALVIAFVDEIIRYRTPEGRASLRIAWCLFSCCYLGIPLAFLIALRRHGGNRWGLVALISAITIVKMSDVGAYMFGKLFGRHKMSPRLSPGKTIEGAVGGIVLSIVTAVLCRQFMPAGFVGGEESRATGSVLAWSLYGALLAITAIAGDLAESLLKRDLGTKDSSRWLPGLGGVLDVIDSVLFAAPVGYLCWLVGLVGPAN